MKPPADALERAWLVGPEEPLDLRALVEATRRRIDETRGEGLGDGILLCYENPEAFLAGWLSALLERVPVFLADPKWSTRQWAQLEEGLAPGLILTDQPLPFHPESGPDRIGFDDCVGIPTGGTGGRIRFALHRWETLAASARATAQFFGLEAISSPALLPLHHVSGLMPAVRALETGGVLRLPGREESLTETVQASAREAPGACLSLVPTQLQRLLDAGNPTDLRESLRRYACLFLGGGPASAELLDAARRAELPVCPVYGMTETASMVAAQPADAFKQGQPLELEPLPHASFETEAGRLAVRAGSLFLGYYPEMPRPRERFLTGDRAELTPEGRLRLHGRADRILNTGGEKVDAALVEQAIIDAGLAAECLVFGRPDPEWGTAVTALMAPHGEIGELPLGAFRKRLAKHLAPASLPRALCWVDTIPRNAAGKPDWPAIDAFFNASD